MTSDPTDALLALGTATLAESGARPLAPGLQATWPGAALAAPACPARCARGDNLAIHHATATAPPGSALVVTVEGEDELGWWGEVLTTGALARGVRGLVLDAHVRDTAAIAALGFPVWARGTALPGAQKRVRGSVGEPITIRGALVEPGDWVVADGDGVAIIPGSALADVVAAGQARAEREDGLFAALREGRTTIELLELPEP